MHSLSLGKVKNVILIFVNQGVIIIPVTISSLICKVEHARKVGICAESLDHQ
jgi:hypothetical protein